MSIPRNLGNFADNVNVNGKVEITGINATGTPSASTALLGNGTWASFATSAATPSALGTVYAKTNNLTAFETFLGYQAGNVSTGINNTFIGYQAGLTTTSGTNNIVIGSGANASSATVSNEITVGATSIVSMRLRGIVEHNMAIFEQAIISATAATGTIAYYARSQSVLYYTSNASANWTVNLTGASGVTLDSIMQTGQSMTVAFLVTQGSTAYYNNAIQVDGSSVTPKWQGGTAPTTGNINSVDTYVYTVIKTASATFTVLASQTKFA